MSLFFLIYFLGFIVALSIHEFAHAWLADRLGDPHPRLSGRLSLNPLAHLDPIGTLALPLFLVLSGSPLVIGWAKPVTVDEFNFRQRRRDLGLVSLAGPAANFLTALLAGAFIRLGRSLPISLPFLSPVILVPFIQTSLSLAWFNLLPLHPLDGGKVLTGFLPPKTAVQVDLFLKKYGQIILLFLIFPFFGRSLISPLLGWLVQISLNLIL